MDAEIFLKTQLNFKGWWFIDGNVSNCITPSGSILFYFFNFQYISEEFMRNNKDSNDNK